MIRFHYHVAHADAPRLGIRTGDRLCHVFSDLLDVAAAEQELRAWAETVGPRGVRLQRRGERRQHYDLWGPWLAVCGSPADRPALKRWLRPSRVEG